MFHCHGWTTLQYKPGFEKEIILEKWFAWNLFQLGKNFALARKKFSGRARMSNEKPCTWYNIVFPTRKHNDALLGLWKDTPVSRIAKPGLKNLKMLVSLWPQDISFLGGRFIQLHQARLPFNNVALSQLTEFFLVWL